MSARTIHKYEVHYGEAATEMRVGARPLHVGVQAKPNGWETGVFVWAEVPTDAPETEIRGIGYFATGVVIPDGAKYVGTAVTLDTTFAWHVYELPGAKS